MSSAGVEPHKRPKPRPAAASSSLVHAPSMDQHFTLFATARLSFADQHTSLPSILHAFACCCFQHSLPETQRHKRSARQAAQRCTAWTCIKHSHRTPYTLFHAKNLPGTGSWRSWRPGQASSGRSRTCWVCMRCRERLVSNAICYHSIRMPLCVPSPRL